MSISIEIEGLDELIAECEKLATPRELETTNKKALKKCGNMAKSGVKGTNIRSKDVSKSGRKGSRTYKHALDNIPMSIKKKDGQLYIIVGWEKGDNSSYYYMKFIEFGSSKQPPSAPFKRIFIHQRKEWTEIFKQEYEELLNKIS